MKEQPYSDDGKGGANRRSVDSQEPPRISSPEDLDVTRPSGAPPAGVPARLAGPGFENARTVTGANDLTALLPGTLIAGRFEVVRTLGQGGMGIVYECRDRQLERRVAVKRLLPSLSGEHWSVPRFVAEAKAVAAITHPNVMAIHDLIEEPSGLSIVMEYVEGEALLERLKREGKLSVEEATRIILRVGMALDAAHRTGIVHRDIKPGNIMLDTSGGVKLGDFGLAQLVGESDLTRTGTAMGTWVYASPEQLKDAKHVDQRSDLYALGATMYEAITGEMPRQVDERLLPSAFVPVVRKCLAKSPEDRYQTAQEFVAALTEAFRAYKREGGGVGDNRAPAGLASARAVPGAVNAGPPIGGSRSAWQPVAPVTNAAVASAAVGGGAASAVEPASSSHDRRVRVLWRARGVPWSQPLPIVCGIALLIAVLFYWGYVDTWMYALFARIPAQYLYGADYHETLVGTVAHRAANLPWHWIGLVVGILLAAFPPLERLASKFRLSPNRLTAREGILLRNEHSFPLGEIREVRVVQGPLGSLLNYGDVSVTNRLGDVLVLRGVPNPSAARARIAGTTHADGE